jgi:hypothetical protein
MNYKTYENYPLSIIYLSTAITLLSYSIGALIFYLIGGLVFGGGYLFLCSLSSILSMRFRCSYCYYYGLRCPSGLGALAKLLFNQRDNSDFSNPKNILKVASLSFFLLFIPIIVGIVFIIIRFSFFLLFSLLAYFLIAVISSFAIRKNLLCKHCKQGEIGCPAYEGMKGNNKN